VIGVDKWHQFTFGQPHVKEAAALTSTTCKASMVVVAHMWVEDSPEWHLLIRPSFQAESANSIISYIRYIHMLHSSTNRSLQKGMRVPLGSLSCSKFPSSSLVEPWRIQLVGCKSHFKEYIYIYIYIYMSEEYGFYGMFWTIFFDSLH